MSEVRSNSGRTTPRLANRSFELARWVDAYVEQLLRRHEWIPPREGKLIRDAVHGYQVLEPHEVAVLDLPLLQRLRGIHQTAMTYFVYPTATHTRFDHSLGVAKMVDGMIEGLRMKTEVSAAVRRRVRLAALL